MSVMCLDLRRDFCRTKIMRICSRSDAHPSHAGARTMLKAFCELVSEGVL